MFRSQRSEIALLRLRRAEVSFYVLLITYYLLLFFLQSISRLNQIGMTSGPPH